MYPKLYNSNGQVLAVLDNIIKETASIKRVVNGEFTFAFEAYEKELKSEYFNPDNSIMVDDQMFDIKYIEQNHETDVKYSIQCEHVNYRMEDGEENLFSSYTYIGTPTQILSNILAGTEFSVGIVEFTDTITITVNTEITRKSLIYELANTLGGEVDYTNLGFTINILASIGKNNGFQARFGKNLKGIQKIIDNRGGLKTYYSVDIIMLKNSNEYMEKELRDLEIIDVGDTIQLIDPVIGLDLQNRILSREYNPIFEVNTKLEIANNIELITTKINQIETSTVHKNKIYNGVYISAEDGFVAERSDKKAKTFMNATEGISIYSDLGDGLERNFYVDLDGRIKARAIDIDADGTFGGTLTAEALEAIKANIDVVVSNTVITETLYADKGNIADLTVNKLDTSIKVDNYKLRYHEDFATNIEKQQQSVSDVNYIKAYEQHIEFRTGSVKYDEDGVPLTEQATDNKGRPLYWVNNTHTASTYEPNDLPVMIYQYDETIKLSISFRRFDETYEPYIVLGRGIGSTLDPDRGKAFIRKDTEGLVITYKKADGTDVYLRLGEDGISLSHDVLSALNFYSNGFIAKYGETQVGYRWTKDGSGRITQLENIYTSDVAPVTWNGGAI